MYHTKVAASLIKEKNHIIIQLPFASFFWQSFNYLVLLATAALMDLQLSISMRLRTVERNMTSKIVKLMKSANVISSASDINQSILKKLNEGRPLKNFFRKYGVIV